MEARCVLVALAMGCSASSQGQGQGQGKGPSATAAAITNGADDPDDPAVVLLVTTADMKPVCSGVLLTDHAVLTAAHCMIDEVSFDQFSVVIGGQAYTLADALVHPQFDAASFAHDLAVLPLRESIGVMPLPLDGRMVDDTLVGKSFTVVGYGTTSASSNDSGVKRKGTSTVTAVGALDFTAAGAPSQPCAADSGGPALFLDGTFQLVTGLVSHGDDACTDHAVFTRLDVERPAFIDPTLQSLANGSDGLGERCYFDLQCRSGPCVQASDEPQRWYCSKECQSNADCAPSTMVCASGLCSYAPPSPGALSAACSGDGDCASGLCQANLCAKTCVLSGDCPKGWSCQNSSGIQFVCVKDPVVVQSGCEVSGGDGGLLTVLGFLAWSWARRRRRGWWRRPAS